MIWLRWIVHHQKEHICSAGIRLIDRSEWIELIVKCWLRMRFSALVAERTKRPVLLMVGYATVTYVFWWNIWVMNNVIGYEYRQSGGYSVQTRRRRLGCQDPVYRKDPCLWAALTMKKRLTFLTHNQHLSALLHRQASQWIIPLVKSAKSCLSERDSSCFVTLAQPQR